MHGSFACFRPAAPDERLRLMTVLRETGHLGQKVAENHRKRYSYVLPQEPV